MNSVRALVFLVLVLFLKTNAVDHSSERMLSEKMTPQLESLRRSMNEKLDDLNNFLMSKQDTVSTFSAANTTKPPKLPRR